MSTPAVVLTTVALSLAAVLALARVLRTGTLADRTLGLDMLVVVLAAAVVGGAAVGGGTSVFLTVVTVVALLAFVATVTVARFLEPPRDDDATSATVAPRPETTGRTDDRRPR